MPIAAPSEAHGDAAEGPHAEAGHVEQADNAAADIGRRIDLHQRLRHRVERQLEETGGKQQRDRQRINPDGSEREQGQAP